MIIQNDFVINGQHTKKNQFLSLIVANQSYE